MVAPAATGVAGSVRYAWYWAAVAVVQVLAWATGDSPKTVPKDVSRRTALKPRACCVLMMVIRSLDRVVLPAYRPSTQVWALSKPK